MLIVDLTGFEITSKTHLHVPANAFWEPPPLSAGGAIPWAEYKGQRELSSSMHLSLLPGCAYRCDQHASLSAFWLWV